MTFDGLPSTPGAYHAAHLHWRWGKYFQSEHKIASYLLPVNEAGKMQFVSKIKLGGPLLDNSIASQSIQFGIAQINESRKPESDTPRNMNDYFKTDKDPEQISDKDTKTKKEIEVNNLCLWYSVEVFSSSLLLFKDPKRSTGINGSVFIHGLFFCSRKRAKEELNSYIFLK